MFVAVHGVSALRVMQEERFFSSECIRSEWVVVVDVVPVVEVVVVVRGCAGVVIESSAGGVDVRQIVHEQPSRCDPDL